MGKNIVLLGPLKPSTIENDSEQGKEIQIWIPEDRFGSSVERSEGQDGGKIGGETAAKPVVMERKVELGYMVEWLEHCDLLIWRVTRTGSSLPG